MTPFYRDARETLAALAGGCSRDEYVNLVWSQRYPHNPPTPSKTGWPVKRTENKQ